MKLEEFRVYQDAMKMAEEIWNIVIKWSNFEKRTVGEQFVRAVESIAANLSEGFGRYHFREAKHFGYYSRGSLYETLTWLTKAYNRQLVTKEFYFELKTKIKDISVRLNNYIYSIGNKLPDKVEEDDSDFLNYGMTTE